jgi:hypothetical protein
MRHLPMLHVQGYSGSHWTLPSGDYLLRITLAAARATANKTTHFADHFDGHRDAVVLYRAHCPMEEVQGFHISHYHYTLPSGKHAVLWSLQCCYLAWCLRCDGDFVGRWQLLHRGVTYQSDRKDLVDGVEYFYQGAKLVS